MSERSIHVDVLIERLLKSGATELRLSVGSRPRVYKAGQFECFGSRAMTRDDLEHVMQAITPDAQQRELHATNGGHFHFEFGHWGSMYVRLENWKNDPEIVI